MYKDTAKWLLAFLPVSTLAGAAAVLRPHIGAIREVGGVSWVQANPWNAIAFGLPIVVVLGLAYGCLRVMLAKSDPYERLEQNQTWMSEAFSQYGVGIPEFNDSSKFTDAIEEASNGTDGSRADDIAKVVPRIVALSAELNARTRFVQFAWGYGIGLVAIAVCALYLSQQSVPLATPLRAEVHVGTDSEPEFTTLTGCADAATTKAVAIGGTNESPVLRLYGDDCKSIEWQPDGDIDVVVITD